MILSYLDLHHYLSVVTLQGIPVSPDTDDEFASHRGPSYPQSYTTGYFFRVITSPISSKAQAVQFHKKHVHCCTQSSCDGDQPFQVRYTPPKNPLTQNQANCMIFNIQDKTMSLQSGPNKHTIHPNNVVISQPARSAYTLLA